MNNFPVLVDNDILAEQLQSFGIKPEGLNKFLYKTGAVLAGGAVTHYLWNKHSHASVRQPPENSDLDFWVYSPTLAAVGEECSDSFHMRRAYHNLVQEQLQMYFPEFEELPWHLPHEQMLAYIDMVERFRVQGHALISVKWYKNKTTGRTINLIFISQPVAKAVANFDLPLCRALIMGTAGTHMLCTAQCQAIADIKDRRLTVLPISPEPLRLQERIKKYINRYGLIPRGEFSITIQSQYEAHLTSVVVNYDTTVADLKKKIETKIGASPENWNLLTSVGEKLLDMDRPLHSFGLKNGEILRLLRSA